MSRTTNRSWWGRHPILLIVLGSGAVLGAFAGVFALIVIAVLGLVTSSEVYRDALLAAQLDGTVQAHLGTPIDDGLLIGGQIEVNGSSGWADISIPISGPDGAGRIYAEADKSGGRWTFSALEVVVADGDVIDLLD